MFRKEGHWGWNSHRKDQEVGRGQMMQGLRAMSLTFFFFSPRKRPVSWWVTQVGHGPQGSCPPKGRPPDKTLCEACSSGPSWLALDGVWGARDTHREVI